MHCKVFKFQKKLCGSRHTTLHTDIAHATHTHSSLTHGLTGARRARPATYDATRRFSAREKLHANPEQIGMAANKVGNGSAHDQMLLTRERCERVTRENADLSRRLKSTDERANELQDLLTASQGRTAKATEALVVEQAERKLVAAAVTRAEATAADLRGQLSSATARCERAEAEAKTLQSQLESALRAQQQVHDERAQAQREATHASDHAARMDAHNSELRAEGARREMAAAERLATLEEQRDEARGESARLQSALAVSEAESRTMADALEKSIDVAAAERVSLRELLLEATQRNEMLQSQVSCVLSLAP